MGNAKKLEHELQEIRIQTNSGVVEANSQNEDLQRELTESKFKIQHEREQLHETVVKMLQDVVKFKLNIQEILEGLEASTLEELEELDKNNLEELEAELQKYTGWVIYLGCPCRSGTTGDHFRCTYIPNTTYATTNIYKLEFVRQPHLFSLASIFSRKSSLFCPLRLLLGKLSKHLFLFFLTGSSDNIHFFRLNTEFLWPTWKCSIYLGFPFSML